MIPLSKPIDLRYVVLPLDCCEFIIVDFLCLGAEFFSVICCEWAVLDEILFTRGRIAGGLVAFS
jgi:hypothetical protein